MPLYEYQCDACGHRFEVIQKYSDPPAEACRKCGGAVTKLPSSPAIQFKGSGFYITDYARAGKSDTGAGDSGEKSGKGGESKSEAKGDSKAETKSESSSDTKSSDTKSDTKSNTKSDTTSEAKKDSKADTKSSTPPATS